MNLKVVHYVVISTATIKFDYHTFEVYVKKKKVKIKTKTLSSISCYLNT